MSEPPRRAVWLRWISFVVLAGAIVAALRAFSVEGVIADFRASLAELGIWGPVLFGLFYAIGGLTLIPGALLTMAAGALFGLVAGTVLVSIAATVSALLAFLVARYLARDRILRLAARYPRFRAVDAAILKGGWRIVFLLRLSPLFPFSIGNYLYGLTGVRLGQYVLATWIGAFPGTVLYVYLGHVAGAGLGADRERTVLEWVLLGVGVVATIWVVVRLAAAARSAIPGDGGETGEPAPSGCVDGSRPDGA